MNYSHYATLLEIRRAKVSNRKPFSISADSLSAMDEQLFAIPFAKSAVTGLHTPVRQHSVTCVVFCLCSAPG
jgi:hypothetical protein